MAGQTKAEHKRLDAPDETRTFSRGRNEIVTVGGVTIGRITFEPDWHWAEHMKSRVGTESCQVAHAHYAISGRMRTRLVTGEEDVMGAAEAGYTPLGHDAWVVGDEPVVIIDVTGAAEYAKPK